MNIEEIQTQLLEAADLLKEAAANLIHLSVENEAPEPAETGFQGLVRNQVVITTGNDKWLTTPWAEIENGWPSTVSSVHTIFNATLDLAMAAIDYKVVPLGSGGSLDKIHALKEPRPSPGDA